MSHSLSALKIKVLCKISHVIHKALDLEKTLQDILCILSENLSMKRATITLVDYQTGQLLITASHGLTPEEKKRGVYRLDEGVTGLIFQTGKPYYVPDIHKEPLFLNKTGSRKIEKEKISFIGVPIIVQDTPIGVLNVDRLFENNISFEEDIDFLTVVATLIGQLISLNEKVRARVEALKQENVSLKYQLSKKNRKLYIVGKSQAMQEVENLIEKVAPTKATVFLFGESGTGKTLIARIIHEISERANYPFVKVNCASIPDNLLEAELFGYMRGAFTSANFNKPGKFELANRGTIFLDEIGELSLSVQAKLLRVLQDREFERLGSNKTIKVDVRIIAATNNNLEELVEQGKFRADLYYRLNVFPIWVPPLRERKEDIPELLNHFLQKIASEYGRKIVFTPEALELLRNYDWPGNVREMENLVERLAILTDDKEIDADFIKPYLKESKFSCDSDIRSINEDNSSIKTTTSLQELEKQEIIAALKRNNWIQYKAARELGLSQRQMGYRIKKFGLEEHVARERVKAKIKKHSKSVLSTEA